MKKILRPVIFVGEWVLFYYVLLHILVFNMIFFANMIFTDAPWEEPIILPLVDSLLYIVGIGIVCFLYIKYLVGNVFYRKLKEVVWALLFGINLLSCILWFSMSYPFNLTNNDRILLIASILVSAILTIQIVLKFRNRK
ncbi:hypothetical protein [Sutcliffiella cohnii]|uniref:hypothetical protein n=1 Tax=Sutcliffiella cohnii TaxID=33932 RepID=UPI002E21508E|nr:hypothetical protein [Sutcliffiella cohnii]